MNPIHKNFVKSRSEGFLIFLLLLLSGNPIIYRQVWGNIIVVLVGIYLFFRLKKFINRSFKKQYIIFISVFLLIFLIQYFTLGFVSIPFVLGFSIKIFIGGVIFYKLNERFSSNYFEVIFWLCLLSLPFYLVHFIMGNQIEKIIVALTSTNSLGLYTFRFQHGEPLLRNSGMFWEPGVFQGYINLAFFLNLRNLKLLFREKRFKSILILFTLLTTQSTTGFIVFFVIIIFYILTKKSNVLLSTASLIFVLLISIYAFNNLAFLGEKIVAQYIEATSTDREYTIDRFGSLLFDLHYINKHPLTGNGFHEITRYADHPNLVSMRENGVSLRFSNGFTGFIASAGILGLLWYFYCILKFQAKQKESLSIFMIILITLLLQGEPFLLYPLFLGLPFFIFPNKQNIR